MRCYQIIFLILFAMGFASCGNRVMFQVPEALEEQAKKEDLPVIHINKKSDSKGIYEHRIDVDDRISVIFLNDYDLQKQGDVAIFGSAGEDAQTSFLVDKDGNVKLPMVGKVNLLGLTRDSAATKLERLYSKNFLNPNIEVNIVNLYVTVHGEVQTPGVYPLERERVLLTDVLAAAGGILPSGKMDNVRIIRGNPKNPELIIFDLTQLAALRSDELVLNNKDIIYVEPRELQKASDAFKPYTTFFTAVTALGTIFFAISALSR